ncbi:MAG TPA: Dabb family protein [Acidimicrobiales bacterium]|jgi:hypothetical protein|nr:Dabb family protein [Acidimicrobiales bacterium]
MLRHILMFKWTEGAEPEQRQIAVKALESLTDTVPEIRSLKVSESAGLSPGFDGVLEIEVDDADAFGRYVSNESHQQVYIDALKPVWADMAAIQVKG